eukprot:Em0020g682a
MDFSDQHRSYQKQLLLYNRHLPYAELLEDESRSLFEDIKQNLSIAVQKKELWPGALYWTNRLTSYIRVCGLHFPKEDHIKLVHLVYKLVTIPDLEPPLIRTWSTLLGTLLKKWRLLSRDDLILPWRPLYTLVKDMYHSEHKQIKKGIYLKETVQAVKGMLSHVRNYFAVESTQEMLDEWRPLLCPFDLAMVEGLTYLHQFLPTLPAQLIGDHGHRLWFDELIKLWLGWQINPALEDMLINLFARLARHNIGCIDWTPYMNQIFSRILRSFHIPVGPKELMSEHNHSADKEKDFSASQAALLIVSLLGGGSPAQQCLDELMLALESCYHPSNLGHHTKRLLDFMAGLAVQFILRLKRERYSKPSWLPEVPSHAKLNESDIDCFVKCLLPTVQLAMFNKMTALYAASTFHNLALIRSDLVLPRLLESTFRGLGTVNEPHQVTASLQCVAGVCRSLLNGGNGRYTEGRKHVFSLLTMILPGIDCNDHFKTLFSLIVMKTVAEMLPMVDCSSSVGTIEMTEEEKELCLSTGQLEDLVLQYFDRCFALIENIAMEPTTAMDRTGALKSDKLENLLCPVVSFTTRMLLQQCPAKLNEVILEKVFQFATSHVFESQVSGKLCAEICGSVTKTIGGPALKLFIHHCTQVIEHSLEDPDQVVSEHLDKELVWNIQLLSQVVLVTDDSLVPYVQDCITCLKRCTKLKSRNAISDIGKALSNILQSLTSTNPKEYRCLQIGYNVPQHLYIRDWALPADTKELKINWHVPSHEELQAAERVMSEFLQPQLDSLEEFMRGKSMSRDDLHQSLEIVHSVVTGATAALPPWKGKQVEGSPSSLVRMERENYITSLQEIKFNNFSRKALAETAHRLTEYVLQHHEDDTKSMLCLIKLLSTLMLNFSVSGSDIEEKKQSYRITKEGLGDKLRRKEHLVRSLFIQRAFLHHQLRVAERSMSTLTDLHLILIKDLAKLSISAYTEVRVSAQDALKNCLETYLYSGRMVIPDILSLLNNSTAISHDQFKGALHVLLLSPVVHVYLHNWAMMKQTFITILQAGHSEKPSIINLLQEVLIAVVKKYETFSIMFKVPDGCVQAAAMLTGPLSSEELVDGDERLQKNNAEASQDYEDVVNSLSDLVTNEKLLWRCSQMATQFLTILVRHDYMFPVKGVRLLVRCLVHDTLNIRKIAYVANLLLFQQMKRQHIKTPVDIRQQAGVELPTAILPGERPDNEWLCIRDDSKIPRTAEQWKNFVFIDKTHWGYYCWPKTLYTYAPASQQPKMQRNSEEMCEGERAVMEAFSSQKFIDKMVEYLCFEENKGKDRYKSDKAVLFKELFRSFGNSFLPLLKPHLERLAADQQESNQRCAVEIIAGLIAGSKHWSYEMQQDLQTFLTPLIRKVMESVTPETIDDWIACFSDISADRDPRRLHWLFEILTDTPLRGTDGAFLDSSRLQLLQAALAQQEWRVPLLAHRVLEYIKGYLAHPFKSVRTQVAQLLAQLFYQDIPVVQNHYNPKREDFLAYIMALLPPLDQLASPHHEEILRICKTILIWLTCSSQLHGGSKLFGMLATLLPLSTVEDDEEIGPLLKAACASLGHSEVLPAYVPVIVGAMKKLAESSLWKVKVSTLQLLQIMVFENLFVFHSQEAEITELLLLLMQDSQLEVRELAASTLSGLVHCGFVRNLPNLKASFIKHSRIPLPKKLSGVQQIGMEALLVKRHSGVLGLAALIGACPYTVPDWLPEVIAEMAMHQHDPAPLQATVKKAMSDFRRTHHDSWSEHKQKFTDDQLSMLADLLVSPSYYA